MKQAVRIKAIERRESGDMASGPFREIFSPWIGGKAATAANVHEVLVSGRVAQI